MDAGTLHRAIAEVCPVISTVVVEDNNRATWSYEADPSATQPQKDAANNVVATIPIGTVPAAAPADFISRFTDAEYLALKEKHQADITAGDASGVKIWDIVIGKGVLNLNTPEANALKADLVSDSILTQARADEIFGGPASRKLMF